MIDVSKIVVRRACSDDDIQKIVELRWKGYGKHHPSKEHMLDDDDFATNTVLLLAVDEDNHAIGTLRIQDGRHGTLELQSYVNIDLFVSDTDKPCAQVSRLVVLKRPDSLSVKCALWKAFYQYCVSNGIKTALIDAFPLLGRLTYRFLLFEDVGDEGEFYHPTYGNARNRTYKLNIQQAEQAWRNINHPFYDFFILQATPNITF